VIFFPGLHQPSDAQHFSRAFISVNRLRDRASGFAVNDWIMDSGAFTEVARHGGYRQGVERYAFDVGRWAKCGNLLAAAAQDFMCEPFVVAKTGLNIPTHQRLTIERYDALLDCDPRTYILPVLQGYAPGDYVRHVDSYGQRLAEGAWVGVGSICKRNASVGSVEAVLRAIRGVRPDLRLHGFGLKITALQSDSVRRSLYSADSMAWSFSARMQGRNANDWREAERFAERVRSAPAQRSLLGDAA
jgi:hypothetical protein